MKAKKITLCWLPPAKTYLPSPAMTVLKQALQEAGFESQIVYWNILLEEVLRKYFFNESKPLDDDIASLGIFFSYIAIERNDKDTLIKQELYLRALKPQYSIKNFDFQRHIKECVDELKSVVVRICHEYNIENSPFVGLYMSLFQWVPAYVIGSIIKRLNANSFIAVGGIGNPEQAQSFIKTFSYIDIAAWGEGENYIVNLAKRKFSGESLNSLPQCYLRDNQEIIRSATTKKEYKNLDELSFLDFSDFFNQYKEF